MHEFNLDLGYAKRWLPIFEEYKDYLEEVKPQIKKLIEPLEKYSGVISQSIKVFDFFGQISWSGEMNSFCRWMGLEFYQVVLLQLYFEMLSGCTAIVTQVNKENVLFRTLDWPLDFLKKLTVDLKVTKSGKVLYYATTWLGYVGMLTVCKPGMIGVAINYRKTKDTDLVSFLEKEKKSLISRSQVGFALRYACENYTYEEDFLRYLKNVELISPCYFTICKIDQPPVIMIRDEKKCTFYTNGKEIICTNCDPDKCEPDILESVRRRKFFESVDKNFSSREELLETFCQSPIIQPTTIYWCYYNPKDPLQNMSGK